MDTFMIILAGMQKIKVHIKQRETRDGEIIKTYNIYTYINNNRATQQKERERDRQLFKLLGLLGL